MYRQLLLLYGLVILLGALTGLLGSCFQWSIATISPWLMRFYHHMNLYFGVAPLISSLTSMAMVFAAWWMVNRFAPEAAGSGVPEIEGVLLHERLIFWRRLLPVKFFGGILALSASMVAGREGPTIQMGGNLGEMFGEWFKIPRRRRDTMIAAGAAAGLATAFNAPIAGVLFIVEEMRNAFNFSFTNFKMVAICCVAATIVQHLFMGAQPAIVMDVFLNPSLESLVWFFGFGIVVGFAGILFNKTLIRCLNQAHQWRVKQRMAYVLGVGSLMGFLAYVYPQIVGGGYGIIEQSLIMRPTLMMLGLLMVLRFITTMMCYSTGVPGGIFAPMLALGTLLGLAFSYVIQGSVDPTIHPGMFAVAGMGALFSATVRAPLTGIVLVIEMTSNYSLILPLMVTCLTSTSVVQLLGNPPIYTQLLHRLRVNT